MTMKWAESIVLNFLDLYQNHDCLWNTQLESYRNRDARDYALANIVKEMQKVEVNVTVADIKNKIKTIRTMYKKELTLVLKSKKSGSGTGDIYKPKIFWFKKADLFLRAVSITRDSTSNSILPNNELETQDETTLSQIDNEFPDSPVHPLDSPATALPHTPQVEKQFGGPPVRKRKLASNNNLATRVSNVSVAIDKLQKLAEKNRSVPDDEFDVFGKHIAAQLKQLPLYNALLCEEQIKGIIRQQRLRLLQAPTQSPAYSYSSARDEHSSLSLQSPTDNTFPALEPTSDLIAEALSNL